jgi:hypothetical protein
MKNKHFDNYREKCLRQAGAGALVVVTTVLAVVSAVALVLGW